MPLIFCTIKESKANKWFWYAKTMQIYENNCKFLREKNKKKQKLYVTRRQFWKKKRKK